MMRLLIFLLFWFYSSTLWGQEPVTLSGEHVSLSGHLALLKDSSNRLSYQEIQGSAAGSFVPLAGEVNVGFANYPVWLRVDLMQPADTTQDWYLEISNPLIDNIDLYFTDRNGVVHTQQIGEDVPRTEWEIDARTPMFKLHLPPGLQRVYLRLSARNSLSTTLSLWRADVFSTMVQRDSLAYGLYFGMYALLMVFQFLIWRQRKEHRELWYLLYIGSNVGSALISLAIPQQYTNIPGLASDTLLGIFFSLALGVSTKTLLIQLDIYGKQPRLARCVAGLIWIVTIFSTLIILFGNYSLGVRIIQTAGLAAMIFFTLNTLWLILHGYKFQNFLLIAFGAFYLSVGIRFLRNLGFIEPGYIADNSYQTALLLHMVVMSWGISNQHRQRAAEDIRTQAESLASTLQMNSALESRVSVRTAELVDEIHRRKILEAELRQALKVGQQALEDQRGFVAMVSHEFRTPLTIIDTSMQQLQINPNAPPEKTRARFRNAENAIARMIALIDDYLSMDRLQSFDASPNMRPINMHMLLKCAAEEWPAGRVRVRVQMEPAEFCCDPDLLLVALRNLIANANRHSPAEAGIEIHAQSTVSGSMEMTVRDSGEGITNSEIGSIFNKYMRGSNVGGKPGAGLGLYLVREIVKLHGGSIRVDSTLGHGTVFTLVIPAAS